MSTNTVKYSTSTTRYVPLQEPLIFFTSIAMESTSILCSPNIISLSPKNGQSHPKRAFARVFASRKEPDHDQNYSGGRLVDESMIVLRRRMHVMKMMERNYKPPSEWMDWEKQFYTSYDSSICHLMGFLQIQLMNTRPGLALGLLSVLILSVPTSTALVLFHLMEITKV
jgi:hypothetical protein